jgi:POT family proton-dependent oligopeptide transporter
MGKSSSESGYLTTPPATDKMPGGIPYIIGNEAAERFSFYGMKGILTIFMVAHLKNSTGAPDHMTEEHAKTVYHMFTAAAYFFPLLGSLISDILWGKYRTILFLSLGYCVGHACIAMGDFGVGMALLEPRTWLFLGLIFIAVGAGGIKPCVSAHVGDQFGTANQSLLSKTFSWFYFAINLGAAASNLLTPWLLERQGPWLAFGLPGVLMGLATFVFWMGRHKFVHIPPAGFQHFKAETFGPDGLKAMKNLIPLFLVFVPVFWSIFDQTGSAWVLQATRMDRRFLGIEWLESQVQAVNPVLILVLIPFFSYVVYPVAGKFVQVTPLRKIGTGLFLTVVAFGLSAWIEEQIQGGAITSVTSQGDRDEWKVDNLIDGDVENTSWVSSVDRKFRSGDEPSDAAAASSTLFPQVIVFQLRESRAWTIEGVRIHPANNLGRFLMQQRDKSKVTTSRRLGAAEVDTCHAKTIRISVADTPNPRRGWRPVGTISLARSIEAQQADIRPVEAKYVKLEILENWGGPFVGLAEVEIMAQGELPADSGGELAEVWPNVAAMGYRPNIFWQFIAYILLTTAEVLVSIVSLEFAYTQAPKAMKSFIMGIYFLGVSLGNLFTAAVNSFIQNEDGTTKLAGASYYWFFTILILVTALVYLVWSQFYRGQTYIQGTDAEVVNPNIVE